MGKLPAFSLQVEVRIQKWHRASDCEVFHQKNLFLIVAVEFFSLRGLEDRLDLAKQP